MEKYDSSAARGLVSQMERYYEEIQGAFNSINNISTSRWNDNKNRECWEAIEQVMYDTGKGLSVIREYKDHLKQKIDQLEN